MNIEHRRRGTDMRNLRHLGSMAAAAVLIAACGSGSGGPGATGAGATQGPGNVPGATDSGGGGTGGGAIDTSKGKAHYEVTGAKTASGDLGFFATTSVWAFNGENSALLYWVDNGSTSLSISYSPGASSVVFATQEFGVTLLPINGVIGTCTVDMAHIDASSASGTFKCEHAAIVNSDSTLGEGTLTGSFEAHK
jgi:hypothetical protein